jgi:hypothetical protein
VYAIESNLSHPYYHCAAKFVALRERISEGCISKWRAKRVLIYECARTRQYRNKKSLSKPGPAHPEAELRLYAYFLIRRRIRPGVSVVAGSHTRGCSGDTTTSDAESLVTMCAVGFLLEAGACVFANGGRSHTNAERTNTSSQLKSARQPYALSINIGCMLSSAASPNVILSMVVSRGTGCMLWIRFPFRSLGVTPVL